MKKDLHLLVTTICDRDCKYCCNKQYDLNDVPYVTEEELNHVENVYITGGEPFKYSDPENIACYLKGKYSNIRKVVVYTNAYELANYLESGRTLFWIDGVTVSVKSHDDQLAFNRVIERYQMLNAPTMSNRLYISKPFTATDRLNSWDIMEREWQPEFKPAPNCIFRRI